MYKMIYQQIFIFQNIYLTEYCDENYYNQLKQFSFKKSYVLFKKIMHLNI